MRLHLHIKYVGQVAWPMCWPLFSHFITWCNAGINGVNDTIHVFFMLFHTSPFLESNRNCTQPHGLNIHSGICFLPEETVETPSRMVSKKRHIHAIYTSRMHCMILWFYMNFRKLIQFSRIYIKSKNCHRMLYDSFFIKLNLLSLCLDNATIYYLVYMPTAVISITKHMTPQTWEANRNTCGSCLLYCN
jgi:hypothetical protein